MTSQHYESITFRSLNVDYTLRERSFIIICISNLIWNKLSQDTRMLNVVQFKISIKTKLFLKYLEA